MTVARCLRLLFFAMLITSACSFAGESDAQIKNSRREVVLPELLPADLKLVAGEHLVWNVRVNGVPAGKVQADVRRAEPFADDNTKQVWVATMEMRSNRAISLFFEVKNKARTMIDCKGGFSRYYHSDRDEGEIDAEERISFKYDYGAMEALFERPRLTDHTRQPGQPMQWVARKIPLTGKVLDPLAAMYYVRSIDFSKLTYTDGVAEIALPVCSDRRVWNTKVLVHQPTELKEKFGPLGKRSCIVVEPQMEFAGLFQRKGNMTVWLDAETKIPLKARVDIAIGTAEVLLDDHLSAQDPAKGYSPFVPGSAPPEALVNPIALPVRK
jgi:hypothetical protein